MSTFTLLVTAHPLDDYNSTHGVNFARQIIAKGHSIKGVFFYGPGVANANALAVTLTDRHNVVSDWASLATEHDVSLYTCVTAANARGIVSELDANDADLAHHNLAEHVTSCGLAEFVDLANSADRVVQF